MEVPSEVLQKLVCERCSGYLSRGPVHLVENTKYRCRRCPSTEEDEEEGIRVEAYEDLAKLMSFPCRYQGNGCTSKVAFTDNERHEQACPFREYLCPIVESGQCEWTGLQTGILEHCQQDHPSKVVRNPCKFTYDITRPSLNNYVLFAFEVLFLIQSKVCTATRKIYHAVRLIDDPARASNFKYTLDIENKHGKLTKYGIVAPRELLVLQEDTSVVTGINSLLEFLGDFKDTTFTVTVESSGQGTSSSNTLDHVTPPVKTLEVTVLCGTCRNSTRGCTYSDIRVKCSKHASYYCQYSTRCFICSKTITGTTLDSYHARAHGDVIHRTGTVCTVSPVAGCKWLIIECDFGRAVCGYRLVDSYFVLEVYTPLPSAQLYKYMCTVGLSHPDMRCTYTITPAVQYSQREDWYVRIPRSQYNTYVHDNEVNIKINITKIDDPSQFMD